MVVASNFFGFFLAIEGAATTWRQSYANSDEPAMSGKFNLYDLKAFLQAIIAFVFLFGLLVATAAVAATS